MGAERGRLDDLSARAVEAELTSWWTEPLNVFEPHAIQRALWDCPTRFVVAVAGRRSGKTRLAWKRLVRAALSWTKARDGRFVYAAPTRDQAKRIAWAHLKAMVPQRFVVRISEVDLAIWLVNGARIEVVGLDRPIRAEGDAIDGMVLDEYADMREEVWNRSLRLSLGTRGRPGWCWFIGKPRGRNHFYERFAMGRDPEREEWESFHWTSETVLPPEEIESLRSELDPLSYQQEVLASFVNFEGRAYYMHSTGVQDSYRLAHDPGRPIDVSFDFNVDPGVCVVSQEQEFAGTRRFDPVWIGPDLYSPYLSGEFTACIGEVHIPRNSNTIAVCRELVRGWASRHEGVVRIYGDATGGGRHASQTAGTCWDQVREELRKVDRWRLVWRVPRGNPYERVRTNAVNRRLMSSSGRVRMLVDPVSCPMLLRDLEGVSLKRDGSGEIDKKRDPKLSHLSDGIGYRIHHDFPVEESLEIVGQM